MLTAIILAGGKSRRMGTDKCFLELNGKNFIELAISLASEITDNVIISSKNAELKKFGFPVIADEYKNIGPLAGLYSALKYSLTDKNIILPCDLPFLKKELFNYLLSFDDFDAVVPVFRGKAEPLIAILNKRVILKLKEQIISSDYKVLNFYNRINTKFVEIDENLDFFASRMFININKPEDFNKICK